MWFDQSASFSYQPQQQTLRLAVPSRFVANWIERQLHQTLRQVVDQELGTEVSVQVAVDPDAFEAPVRPGPARESGAASAEPAAEVAPHASAQPAASRRGAGQGQARTPSVSAPMRHQLTDFIVGPSNELAYAAARRLVEDNATAGQPLFLHGGCGVGKTHLLQGLCHAVQQVQPQAKVLYTTGERFTNEYIAAVRNNQLEQFRRTMRELDLLAVDDIHFLANKQATQQEFLHSFNEIELGGARLALASDSHPKLIEQFSEALVNRCVRGLVVRINEPDEATRYRLVEALAKRRGLVLQTAAIEQLAARCHGSVREIEGLLTKLHALSTLNQRGGAAGQNPDQPIGRAMIDQLLSHDAPAGPRRPVAFETLRDVVAEELCISVNQLTGSSRQKQVVLARSVLVHLARDLTSMSFPEIARAMGRSNHSTTITAAKRMQRQLDADEPLHLPGYREPMRPTALIEQIKRALCRHA
jgi:chromosomal replication initiator protein